MDKGWGSGPTGLTQDQTSFHSILKPLCSMQGSDQSPHFQTGQSQSCL